MCHVTRHCNVIGPHCMVRWDVTFICGSPDSFLFVEVGLASKTITAVPDFSSVITTLVIKCCLVSIDRFVNNTVFSFFIVVLPKYGRVNLLKSTFDNAVQMLVQSGFTLHNWEHVIHLCKACTAAESQPLMSEISRPTICDHSCFAQDPHVPDLLVFCPSVHLLEHPLYTSGRIMLQDKVNLVFMKCFCK